MSNILADRLDKWLWRRQLGHPVVMPVIRNELLCSGCLLALGLLLYLVTNWVFWFGAGFAIMALTLYSLARFFLRTELTAYSPALFMSVLFRWAGRLLLTVCLLYFALVVCAAPVTAVLAGLVCATILAFVTYALQTGRH